MRVLLVHNRYQRFGGEDAVFESERDLLRGAGHDVEQFVRSNDEIRVLGRLRAAVETPWSWSTYRDAGALIEAFKPDVVHCHNTFPLITPSIYFAAQSRGVPVVQTLHNFRLTCLNAMLFREGSVCTQCVGTLPWRGVVHGCYQDARPQSTVAAFTLALHRLLRTYRTRVDAYIALTESARSVFVAAGLPSERIRVKPNFVAPTHPSTPRGVRTGVLYVGRLSREKGIDILADVAKRLVDVRFRVFGDGPESWRLDGLANVERSGHRPREEVLTLMRASACLFVPSQWYEGFPMVVAEAFASGLPVIGSRLGALADIVEDGHTGVLCEPGDTDGFAGAICGLLRDPERLASMSASAATHSRQALSASANLAILESIYRDCRKRTVAGDPAKHD